MWPSGKMSLKATRKLKSQNAPRTIINNKFSNGTKNTKLFSCTLFLIILTYRMAGRSHLEHMEGSLYEILDSMNCQMKLAININNQLENQNLSSQATSVTRPLTPCTSTQTRSLEQTHQPISRPCVPTNPNISSRSSISHHRYPHPPVTATPPLSDAWSKTCRPRRPSSKPIAGSHSRPLSSTRWPHS